MNTSLVVMAAGIGSRYGGGIKQLEPVGLHDEIIMDYSIHDAVEAGFNKIVIIIRHDIEEAFRERIGKRVEKVCSDLGIEIYYAYQDIKDVPENAHISSDRTKPFGTGHAVLSARKSIKEPFCVINADDYYGKRAFKYIHDFLVANQDENAYCMAGFILKNTLSDNGSVTRGVCQVENGHLTQVIKTHDIIKTSEGAEANGERLDPESYVSMNMWELTEAYIPLLQDGFVEFFNQMNAGKVDLLMGEYLLPNHIQKLLQQKKITVKVLPTEDKWFGVTYKEDKPVVVQSFRKLIENRVYTKELYSDLK